MYLTTVDDIDHALQQAGFELTDPNGLFLTHPILFAMISYDDNEFIVFLAERKTFGSWANSCNFKIVISRDNPFVDLPGKVQQAVTICESGQHNFSEHFETIVL